MYVINGKKNDTFADLEIICWKGNPYITETMSKPDGSGPLKFRIGPNHFIKPNSDQAHTLYLEAWKLARSREMNWCMSLYRHWNDCQLCCSPCKKSDRPGVRG